MPVCSVSASLPLRISKAASVYSMLRLDKGGVQLACSVDCLLGGEGFYAAGVDIQRRVVSGDLLCSNVDADTGCSRRGRAGEAQHSGQQQAG
jgi:hypothetical protein